MAEPNMEMLLLNNQTTMLTAAAVMLAGEDDARRREEEEKARARKGRLWVRPWISRREELGHYHRLMEELRQEDKPSFKNLLRLIPEFFDNLVIRLTPRLLKQNTQMREAICPGEKVAATLFYLATGNTYTSMKWGWRLPHNTLSLIVREVCEAIIAEFTNDHLYTPSTQAEWLAVAQRFEQRWQYHNCLGAIDGKHVRIQKPPKSGSRYYNYKGFFSLVLMAVVDARYRFIWYSVGAPGSCSDAQIWNNCDFRAQLEDGSLDTPPAAPLPFDDTPVPYHIIGDAAFALHTTLMKPYGSRHQSHEVAVLNYRISRPRNCVEDTFGMLTRRFQFLTTPLRQDIKTSRAMVAAAVGLHNHIIDIYPDRATVEVENQRRAGHQSEDTVDMQPRSGAADSRAAREQRDHLKDYYNGPGAVPWQDRMVRKQ